MKVKVHLSFERSRRALKAQSRVCAADVGAQSIPIDATLIVDCGLRIVDLGCEIGDVRCEICGKGGKGFFGYW